MEFKLNGPSAIVEVLKINNTMTAEGYEKNVDLQKRMALIVDEIGKLSGMSQGVKLQETSAEKLINSNHVIYMMIEHSTSPNFTVIGILKIGQIKMHLYDKTGLQLELMDLSCLLDFYIHETRQRKGYGKRLMDYMLQDIDLSAGHLAIDKPNKKILNFMQKHFQLSKMINQANNIIIYEDFFHADTIFNKFDEKNDDNSENRSPTFGWQPTFGQHVTHKHQDIMGNVVQDAASVNFKYNHVIDLFTSDDNDLRVVNQLVHKEIFTDDFQTDLDML